MGFDISDLLQDSMEIDDITNELYSDDFDDDDDFDIEDDDDIDDVTGESDDAYFINSFLCTGCGDCEYECPENAIYEDDDETYSIDVYLCSGCGACAAVCDEGAIELLL